MSSNAFGPMPSAPQLPPPKSNGSLKIYTLAGKLLRENKQEHMGDLLSALAVLAACIAVDSSKDSEETFNCLKLFVQGVRNIAIDELRCRKEGKRRW